MILFIKIIFIKKTFSVSCSALFKASFFLLFFVLLFFTGKFMFYASFPKSAEKAVCRSVFDIMTLYFECQIIKNTLFQTVFLAILPTGNYYLSNIRHKIAWI